mmetsp:Transcript_106663/g.302134  ORF Transcript_106663/g.302134 Transcript_106663/m.302134 type:complete len:222 (+) Transcript_106663:104-769(+)
MVEPLRRFLCCLPLGAGVKLLLWTHLAASAVSCSMATGNLLLNLPSFGYATSASAQVFSAVWSLSGIPIILAALYGAYQRVEPHLRFYLYYLAISVVIDAAYIVNLLLIQDSCANLDMSVAQGSGQAFACGIARALSATAAAVGTAILAYMVLVVWSFCEELTGGGSAAAIASLLQAAEGHKLRHSWSVGGYGGDLGPDYSSVERSVPQVGGRPMQVDYGA